MLLFPVFFLGLAVGSFVNVIIYRIPRGLGFVFSRSRCVHCSHNLVWHDLIPVVSFIALRGKCRHCANPISITYPLVELACATLAVLAFIVLGTSVGVISYIFLLAVLFICVALAVIDFQHMLLPDALVASLAVAGAMYALIAFLTHTQNVFGTFSAGAFISGASLGLAVVLLWFVSRGRWIGLGDAKLLGAFGVVFGFPGAIIITYMGIMLGGFAGIIVLLSGRGSRKTKLPLGTFLCLAAIAHILAGRYIVDYITRLLW